MNKRNLIGERAKDVELLELLPRGSSTFHPSKPSPVQRILLIMVHCFVCIVVRVWNTQTYEPLCDPLEGHIDTVVSVTFSPDNRTIISSSHDGTVRIWNAPTADVFNMSIKAQRRAHAMDASLLSWPTWLGPLLGEKPRQRVDYGPE